MNGSMSARAERSALFLLVFVTHTFSTATRPLCLKLTVGFRGGPSATGADRNLEAGLVYDFPDAG